MKRRLIQSLSVCGLILLTAMAWIPLTASAQDEGKAVVKVMTYNVNEGTDFIEVMSAQNLADFLKAVQLTLNNIESTKPPLRMQAVAKEIAQTEPDLVGLQEVTTWSVGGQVKYDMLTELLDALTDLGQQYVPVIVVEEFQLAGPLPDFTMVQGINHDVILARARPDMVLSNIQSGHFSLLLPVPTPVGTLNVVRGWGSVDVALHGKQFRFMVSHLENFNPLAPVTLFFQEQQAAELSLNAANGALPVIIAVDSNADALGNDASIATYQLIRSFGFGDAWALVHPLEPGPTWGYMPDAADVFPHPAQRIDYIFFSNGASALTSSLAGQRLQEKVDGLWPSDHAGVRAGLLLN